MVTVDFSLMGKNGLNIVRYVLRDEAFQELKTRQFGGELFVCFGTACDKLVAINRAHLVSFQAYNAYKAPLMPNVVDRWSNGDEIFVFVELSESPLKLSFVWDNEDQALLARMKAALFEEKSDLAFIELPGTRTFVALEHLILFEMKDEGADNLGDNEAEE